MSQSLLSNLKVLQVKVNDGYIPATGICGAVLYGPDGFNPDDELTLDNIFSLWPDYSGHICYPVPAPIGFGFTHGAAFDRLPKWSGDYGNLRKNLLNFCIKYLEESMK